MPIVLLYLCFFTVQLLSFNSDNISTQLTSWYHTDGLIKTKAAVNTERTNSGKQNNTNIRLNKRFQPQKAICYNVFTIKAPAFHLIEKSRVVYIDNAILIPSFSAHLLRGPPIVA